METASEQEVRRALIAALRQRVEVAGQYLGLETPERERERLRVLTFGAATAEGRPTRELEALHAHALRLIETLAHGPVPVAGVLS